MELSLQSKYIKDLYFFFPPDICHKSVSQSHKSSTIKFCWEKVISLGKFSNKYV